MGIFGFAVVYALMHRAAAIDNVAARAMIYLAALLLFGEIFYMVTATVWGRISISVETREAVQQ